MEPVARIGLAVVGRFDDGNGVYLHDPGPRGALRPRQNTEAETDSAIVILLRTHGIPLDVGCRTSRASAQGLIAQRGPYRDRLPQRAHLSSGASQSRSCRASPG